MNFQVKITVEYTHKTIKIIPLILFLDLMQYIEFSINISVYLYDVISLLLTLQLTIFKYVCAKIFIKIGQL